MSAHDFHYDIKKLWQKWHLSIFLSKLIPYCQYSICTNFCVKWTNIFWDTACFSTVGKPASIFSYKSFNSGVTGSEPGQVRFQNFWAHPLVSIEALPSDGQISPFWFMSPRLPSRVYDLPADKFSDTPLQNSSLEIFCNTPIQSTLCFATAY